MKGDFTRFTHDPKKHYSSVLKQQGRVDLDADWNESAQIDDYLKRTSLKDIIGLCGVPHATEDGFQIKRTSGGAALVLRCGELKPSRFYAGGMLCEMEHDVTVANPTGSGLYLAYLDVWQRHITVVEDAGLAEVALGGPDTTTRVKTEWQVCLENVSNLTEVPTFDCKRFCCAEEPWAPEGSESTGRLAAQAEEADVEEGLCEAHARAGYRGLENRLYRVEVHTGGDSASTGIPVTFKWSRDNGSVVFPIQKIEFKSGKSTIMLKQAGKDDVLSLHIGDWVEVSDDRDDLALKTGTMAQVAEGSDAARGIIVLQTDVSAYHLTEFHPRIRRWDQKAKDGVSLTGGVIRITPGVWAEMEDGVQVSFTSGTYHTGDYWLIPARTRLRDVLWRKTGTTPDFEHRHGTEHQYCALALIDFKEGHWGEPKDCRRIFPSLNELKPSCCIPVHPGENIQQVIDCVIASGGGCICLCDGVHGVHGPLRLDQARNLTIRGENTATILHFYGANEAGEGGFILNGCANVTISGMLIVGDHISSLVSTKSGMQSRPNMNLTFERLTLFNRAFTGEDLPDRCAFRLGHAANITIDRCDMVAETGIISLYGDTLPDPSVLGNWASAKAFRLTAWAPAAGTSSEALSLAGYGIGVHNLTLKNSAILCRNFGIWALKSIGWRITGCQIKAMTAFDSGWPAGMSTEMPYRATLEYIEKARMSKSTPGKGTCIKALVWKDCAVTGCQFGGAFAINAVVWLGGQAADNDIRAKVGLLAMWLHGAALTDNRIQAAGTGIGLCGGNRIGISGNRVSGGSVALENLPLRTWTAEMDAYLTEMVSAYGLPEKDASEQAKAYQLMALWVLMEEATTGLGLDRLRDALQEILDTTEVFKDVPILLMAAAYLHPRLSRLLKFAGRIPMPIAGLEVAGNDFSASRAVIRLQHFLPLSGLYIRDSHLHTLTGQAVEVKAESIAVNPHVIIIGLRYLFKELPPLFDLIAKSASGVELSEERKKVLFTILKLAGLMVASLGERVEPVLEADFRIENNTIRSLRTAIESNLFELAIQNNHVTLEESAYSSEESGRVIELLDKYDSTRDLATGMRQRSKIRMQTYRQTIDTSGSAETVSNDLAQASAEMGKTSVNPLLQSASEKLNKDSRAGDAAGMREALDAIGDILEGYVDTVGIWVKGAGCRIVGNQVIVPVDADSKTWAQGGIRFWDDEGSPIWLITFVEQVLKLYKPDMVFPSLLAATETLIDNNEVIRGIGHGIDISGIANMPLGMGLTDLKLRGNQIRDMAGAGIAFDEKSMTVDADIEGNRIIDCGSLASKAFLGDRRGGLILRNSVTCRVHGNRIVCSSNLELGNAMFAADLQTVYGLSLANNYIQHSETSGYKFSGEMKKNKLFMPVGSYVGLALANLCGAVRLSEMQGEIGILNNDIVLFRGTGAGLVLGNIDTGENEGLIKKMFVAREYRNRYYQKTEAVGTMETVTEAASPSVVPALGVNASVQGNHFESLLHRPFFAFLLANLNELNFSGNNARAAVPATAPGAIRNVQRGVIANNVLDSLTVSQMAAGVIASNSSNEKIDIPASVTAGLNSPA